LGPVGAAQTSVSEASNDHGILQHAADFDGTIGDLPTLCRTAGRRTDHRTA
jgi:hypothetical protein